ncbi:oligopeptide transport system permease protein [Rhodovulum imhoffii]|uniref:Oligopeptide transport system permease protein OppC n=1 Tax=Rhodovulum imhoffii TaxID=365340 RepID=A0A2T5BRC3_9RHOB|nr:ABC transporter permease subunit [Rhodovulum imhoffii]MBK5934459.1 peptide ABC transporter permease [Rhodovulum imhoffii]PTN01806.1 oligopeptide transport system permease protein [Rhodovulum imhoffii]
MTDTAFTDAAVGGRSLWATAMMRLRRNRAAMASIFVLALLGVLAIFGPPLAPHSYSQVYPEFVKVRPSLAPYPQAEQVIPAAERALSRARVEMGEIVVENGTVHIPISSAREIDPRLARYLERSDIFSGAQVAELSADGKTATVTAEVQQLYFLMGTDANGRDLLARILISLRISLMIGALATAVALVIGVAYGATAGFLGGRIDNLMMRFVDILYSLPFVFFVILLVVFFGRNLVLMFLAVGAVEWLDMARIVRGQTLSLRRREFVQAAEALGVSSGAIIRRHIVPNTLGTVIIYMTLLIPKVILLESFLSFLGLGVQEPLTSLGVLISEGAKNMRNAPFMLFFPAVTMTILLFALNFLGDGLRDALDPKDR